MEKHELGDFLFKVIGKCGFCSVLVHLFEELLEGSLLDCNDHIAMYQVDLERTCLNLWSVSVYATLPWCNSL